MFAYIFLFAGAAGGASIANELTMAERQELQREGRFIVDLLQNHHYSGRAFREMESKAMIDRFLDELDPGSDLLPAADREYLHRRFDRTLKSVYLYRGDLQPAFEIFDRFAERARERMLWIKQRLDRGFDFTVADEYHEPEDKPAAFDGAEADRRWELLLKEMIIAERLSGRTAEDAVAEVGRRFERTARLISAYDPLAVRERFLDAAIRSYDPHSGYFSAESSREFAIEMEKAVVGLGIELRKEEGRCIVSSVQSGGAADLNSSIRPGDIIDALAEGDSPWTELAGLRLREVVQRIRGAEGTKLRVAYRNPGGEERREVTLERMRVLLGEDRARGSVSEVPVGSGRLRRIGVIALPNFYSSGEDGRVTSASRDVREILEQMDARALDGLVIDLRRNPGGALAEAVALSDLFVSDGEVMLSRGLEGKVKSHRLHGQPPVYQGPLVVLVDQGSASASEVFAHAMKFHRRALIVGAPATFGKGTVQAYIDLARQARSEAGLWGTLRVTTERFYGPDGESVQKRGLVTDIAFIPPDPKPEANREAGLPGALPEDRLPTIGEAAQLPTGGVVISTSVIGQLQAAVAENQAQLPEWDLVKRERAERLAAIQQPKRTLVYELRQAEWSAALARAKALRRERRELSSQARYPTRAFETKAVQSAFDRDSTRLRDRAEQSPASPRFLNGALLVTLDSGRLKRLHLDDIDYVRHALDADAISAHLAAKNTATEPSTIESFFREAALLEYQTEAELRRLAARLPVGDLECLLLSALEMDGEALRERRSLDVSLRESMRLAAKWSELVSPSPP